MLLSALLHGGCVFRDFCVLWEPTCGSVVASVVDMQLLWQVYAAHPMVDVRAWGQVCMLLEANCTEGGAALQTLQAVSCKGGKLGRVKHSTHRLR
jgi:hypothetical protein